MSKIKYVNQEIDIKQQKELQNDLLIQIENNNDNTTTTTTDLYTAFYDHEKVLKFWRISLPVLILGNIVLIIWSMFINNYSIVYTEFQQLYSQQFFTFFQILKNTWQSECYVLAILLTIFNCVFPIIKLAILFFCWILNGSQISPKLREKLLLYSLHLGRWGFFYVFVSIMIIISSQLQIFILQGQYLIAESNFQPLDGFYCNIFGNILSILITILILFYHRKLVIGNFTNEMQQKKFKFQIYYKKRFLFTVLFLIITTALIIISIIIKAFNFSFQGSLVKNISVKSYSLISLGSNLPKSAQTSDGVIFIQFLYFVTVIIIPLSFLLIISFLWMAELKLEGQKYLSFLIEILNSFQSFDILILSLIIISLEIETFSEYLFPNNENCSQQQTLQSECLYIQSQFNNNLIILVIAAVFALYASLLITGYTSKPIYQKISQIVYIQHKNKINEENDHQNKSTIQ